MKKLTQLFTLLILTLALGVTAINAGPGTPSGLTFTCLNAGLPDPGFDCLTGQVNFTGSNYPHNFHVTLTDSSGYVADDTDYVAPHGDADFTETMFPGIYTLEVSIKQKGQQTVLQSLPIVIE